MNNFTGARALLIQRSIDAIVSQSDFPVPGYVIERMELASKAEIDKLVKQGHVEEVKVIQENNGQIVNAYYTKGWVPSVVRPEQTTSSERPSEVDNSEGSPNGS